MDSSCFTDENDMKHVIVGTRELRAFAMGRITGPSRRARPTKPSVYRLIVTHVGILLAIFQAPRISEDCICERYIPRIITPPRNLSASD